MDSATPINNIRPSYFDEIDKQSDNEMLSLAKGLPDPECFPLAQIQTSLDAAIKDPKLLQYGSPDGYEPLLSTLQDDDWFPTAHQAMITSGAQQAIDVIARAYINPGDVVVVEAPTNFNALQVLQLSQAELVSVGLDENGPDVVQLESLFKQKAAKFFYAIPDFSNPTGLCWTLETRQKVAELCQKYRVTFIEDAPYRQLRYFGHALPKVSDLNPHATILVRSFSKFVSPGMRVAVVSSHPSVLPALRKVKATSDVQSNLPMQSVINDVIRNDNFAPYLERLRLRYQAKYLTMANAVENYIGRYGSMNPIEGGMYCWLTLPEVETVPLAQALMLQGVAVVPGEIFCHEPSLACSALRLNFTNSSHDGLEIAVRRIAKVLQSVK